MTQWHWDPETYLDNMLSEIAAYPELQGQLMARAIRRSRYLAFSIAIMNQPKVETRLHMLLWHLADRWGVHLGDGGKTVWFELNV